MNFDTYDAQAIAAYIRQQRPDYQGPVFIDLGILTEKHAARAETVARNVLIHLAAAGPYQKGAM